MAETVGQSSHLSLSRRPSQPPESNHSGRRSHRRPISPGSRIGSRWDGRCVDRTFTGARCGRRSQMIRASVAGPVIASRMAREAHAAARMGHPALVRVFDFGWTSRGDPYLVMEFVQGERLFALLNASTASTQSAPCR